MNIHFKVRSSPIYTCTYITVHVIVCVTLLNMCDIFQYPLYMANMTVAVKMFSRCLRCKKSACFARYSVIVLHGHPMDADNLHGRT